MRRTCCKDSSCCNGKCCPSGQSCVDGDCNPPDKLKTSDDVSIDPATGRVVHIQQDLKSSSSASSTSSENASVGSRAFFAPATATPVAGSPTELGTASGYVDITVSVGPDDDLQPIVDWFDSDPTPSEMIAAFTNRLTNVTGYIVPFPTPDDFSVPVNYPLNFQDAPFTGLAGLVPKPVGKLKNYIPNANPAPHLISPTEMGYQWRSSDLPVLVPLAIADAVAAARFDLTFVSALILPNDTGGSPQYTRALNAFAFLSEGAADDPWKEIVAAMPNPIPCPAGTGDVCTSWQSDGTDPQLFADFKSVGAFVARGSIGLLLDWRDYAGTAPDMDELTTMVTAFDTMVAGVQSGKPAQAALLGIQMLSADSYTTQQLRMAKGLLLPLASEQPEDFTAAEATYADAAKGKASIVVATDSMQREDFVKILPALSNGQPPDEIWVYLDATLYSFPKESDAVDFAATFPDSLSAQFPDIKTVKADASGFGDGALAVGYRAQVIGYPQGGVIAQVIQGRRVGVMNLHYSPLSPETQKELPELAPAKIAARQEFVDAAIMLAGQMVVARSYRFKL